MIAWNIFTSFTTGNESTLRAGRQLSGGDQSMIDFSFPLADGDYEWHGATKNRLSCKYEKENM